MHIGQEHQQAGKLDAATHNAEFGGLLDAVDGVTTRIGKANDLGARCLRLHQEGREIGRAREGCAYLAQHAPTGVAHKITRVAFKRVTKGVIRRDEEPAIATSAHRGTACGFGQHPSIVSPVYGIRGAGTACQIRGRRRGIQENLVLVADDFIRSQGNRRSPAIHHNINAITVNPLPCQVGPHIRTILVIAKKDFDIEAAIAHLRSRLAHAGQFRRPTHITIGAGEIRQQRDLDGIRGLRLGTPPRQATKGCATAGR